MSTNILPLQSPATFGVDSGENIQSGQFANLNTAFDQSPQMLDFQRRLTQNNGSEDMGYPLDFAPMENIPGDVSVPDLDLDFDQPIGQSDQINQDLQVLINNNRPQSQPKPRRAYLNGNVQDGRRIRRALNSLDVRGGQFDGRVATAPMVTSSTTLLNYLESQGLGLKQMVVNPGENVDGWSLLSAIVIVAIFVGILYFLLCFMKKKP